MSKTTSGFGSGNIEDSPFARFTADTDGETAESAFDRFAAAAAEEAQAQAEEKGEEFDLEKFQADLRLFLFQHYMNNSIGDFTKGRRNTIEAAVEVAADKLSVPSFVARAKLINGEEVEIGKVRVNKTSASTSITHPKSFLGWAKDNAPDLTETRTFLNPHLSPEEEARAYAILREHMPEAVSEVTELKKNAVDLLSGKATTSGNDVVIPAHEAVVEETGEVTEVPEQVIPGLRHDNGGRFKNITIEAGPTKNKYKDRVMDLLIRNQFAGVSTNEIIAQTQKQLESKDQK